MKLGKYDTVPHAIRCKPAPMAPGSDKARRAYEAGVALDTVRAIQKREGGSFEEALTLAVRRKHEREARAAKVKELHQRIKREGGSLSERLIRQYVGEGMDEERIVNFGKLSLRQKRELSIKANPGCLAGQVRISAKAAKRG